MWPVPLVSRRLWIAGALLFALALAFAVWRLAAPPRINVLFITLDTTRADHLGCYGAAAARTPALDQLAREGLLFTHACTAVSMTLPSHATMLTGLLPPEHGLRDNTHTRLAAATPTLPQVFRRRGYRTSAFLASFVLDRRFGLDPGFELYDDRMSPPAKGDNVFNRQNRGDVVCDRALAWLDRNANQPFFCWVHFYDPHMPCTPPPPYDAMFQNPYDGAISFMDSQVRRLLDFIDRRGLRGTTLVVICGDHGEGFGEHGEEGHALLVYQETMRVPLLLRLPGKIPAGKSDRLAKLSQVAPTILDALGWKDPAFGGASLLARETPSGEESYGETLYPFFAYRWSPLASLTTKRWKYILSPEPELYDLANDPREKQNLAASDPRRADDMRLRLDQIRAQLKPAGAEKIALDPQALAQLRSLGYAAGSSTSAAPTAVDTSLPNPVRMVVEVHNVCGEARKLIDVRDLPRALVLLKTVLPKSPNSTEILELLMGAYIDMGQATNALPYIHALLALEPNNRVPLVNLGGIALEEGRNEEAIRIYRQALALPMDVREATFSNGASQVAAKARVNMAICLTNLKRLDEAAEDYRLVLKDVPDHLEANNNLGNVCVLQGKTAAAIVQFRKALLIDPSLFRTRENLGRLLCETGEYREAIAIWRKGLELRPGDPVYLYHLAWWQATCPDAANRNGKEAVRLAMVLCKRVEWSNAQALDCLAAAEAEAGDFAAAAKYAEQGLAQANAVPDGAGLAAEMQPRLALYRQGKPYHQGK